MALIDEYKQAIQDVLDGRAKEAPRPSELPWTEDKAATMWAAAAAELIAEANSGGGSSGGGVLVVNETVSGTIASLDKNFDEIMAAGFAVKRFSPEEGVYELQTLKTLASSEYYNMYVATFSDNEDFTASTSTGTLQYTIK